MPAGEHVLFPLLPSDPDGPTMYSCVGLRVLKEQEGCVALGLLSHLGSPGVSVIPSWIKAGQQLLLSLLGTPACSI